MKNSQPVSAAISYDNAGRDYALDAELAARIERVAGEGSVDLSAQEPPKLALVG